jgi:hypothetical protein
VRLAMLRFTRATTADVAFVTGSSFSTTRAVSRSDLEVALERPMPIFITLRLIQSCITVSRSEEMQGATLTAVCFCPVYHLVGEMFLGAWRVYTSVLVNPFDEKFNRNIQANTKSILDQLPPITRFIFNHAPPEMVWDHGRLNKFFFDSVL